MTSCTVSIVPDKEILSPIVPDKEILSPIVPNKENKGEYSFMITQSDALSHDCEAASRSEIQQIYLIQIKTSTPGHCCHC